MKYSILHFRYIPYNIPLFYMYLLIGNAQNMVVEGVFIVF